MYLQTILLVLPVMGVFAQDEGFDYGTYKAPPPAILMHKQALRHDGAFNYVFAAENGLKQGETIAPDGTRQGAYSYVDPNGQTISVKYTAGKDGFKILQGDHIPKAAPAPTGPPQYISPTQNYLPQYPQARSQFSQNRPQLDESSYDEDAPPPSPILHRPLPALRPEPIYRTPIKPVQEYVPRPEDEHKGPHSFGPGYSFEFAG